ncbi:MAG: DUF1801 domain-containing protein [Burkholderiales bacterium]|nr:DUF1801 domain-containing protein [Burkholderiales bacterium]
MRIQPPISHTGVATKFASYPSPARERLLALRRLIFATAARTEGVGDIEETLKWGEPAYLTTQTGSGSTLRIDWKPSTPTQYAMYFNCQTDLVDRFRTLFAHDFRFVGNRAIVFELAHAVPRDALALCIAAALTYHRRPPKR